MPSESADILIAVAFIFFLFVAFGFLIALVITVILHFRSKEKVDTMEVLAKEVIEVCKVNYNKNLRALWLVPVPSMYPVLMAADEFVANAKKGAVNLASVKDSLELMNKQLFMLLQKYREGAAIYKGRIVGSNVLDRQAFLDELYEQKPNHDGTITIRAGAGVESGDTETFSREEVKGLEDLIREYGRNLNLIVYEKNIGAKMLGLMAQRVEFILCAYDAQIILPSQSRNIDILRGTGDVSILSAGTSRFGRFEFPTGYPLSTKLMAVELKCLTWGMTNRQLISNMTNIVQDAMDMNVGYQQGKTYRELERPVNQPKKND
jgi:hypothetical protein